MKIEKKIAFIGAGSMGSAIIRGLVKSGAVSAKSIVATDLSKGLLKKLEKEMKVAVTIDNKKAVAKSDVILLAVKPQVIKKVIEPVKDSIGTSKLVISIAAGTPIATIEAALNPGARVVRAMPNMAAAVGRSATAVSAGSAAKASDIKLALKLFGAVGEVVAISEKQMDAVTALSGSGPAFVFLFLGALIDAGVRCGLTREVARKLAEQTVIGAGSLAAHTKEDPGALIDRISSPGGTTIAGLAALEEAGFKDIVIRAVEEAHKRSKELGRS